MKRVRVPLAGTEKAKENNFVKLTHKVFSPTAKKDLAV